MKQKEFEKFSLEYKCSKCGYNIDDMCDVCNEELGIFTDFSLKYCKINGKHGKHICEECYEKLK